MRSTVALMPIVIGMLINLSTALAWTPFHTENANAKKGNALMAEEHYSDALEAYNKASKQLPDTPGIQLDKGLALIAEGNLKSAKDAFVEAIDPSAPSSLRADAYYDLGVAFAMQGDALAKQQEYDKASAQYREAVDAFKRALRIQPGSSNTAWNLEYAQARIRDQNQQQDQDQSQQQDQDQNQQQDQDQSQQQDQDQSQQQDQDQSQQQDQDQSQQQDQDQNQQQDQNQHPTPEYVQRFLDALEQNEEQLPVQRARQRNAGRSRPEKDW